MPKTLVAELPSMSKKDFAKFEKEGGIWGRQRAIRRKQLQFTSGSSLLFTFIGTCWTKCVQKNTNLVTISVAPLFLIGGGVIGNSISYSLFPNVASNRETTMMRRLWWAKQCSANWDYSQLNVDQFKRDYPNTKLPSN